MAHVVTHPAPPFTSRNGALEVHQLPAAQDNLVWLCVCTATRQAAAVDGPDAQAVLDFCHRQRFLLTTVINTHTHGDHIGINRDLARRGHLGALRVFGPARAAAAVPGITDPVDDGDTIPLGDTEARVILTEGHLDGHVSVLFDDVLFCGDTLFTGGCGYLFDGPPDKMHRSLERLAALPDHTRVCCAHEYTMDNLRFAWSVEPDNEALAERIRAVWALRGRGECAVPSTIGEEKATNPFLRAHGATLLARVRAALPDYPTSTPAEVFAATRALKDRKVYRRLGDDGLPL